MVDFKKLVVIVTIKQMLQITFQLQCVVLHFTKFVVIINIVNIMHVWYNQLATT